MLNSANKNPSRYGLYNTYDKRRAAKNLLAESRPKVSAIVKPFGTNRKKDTPAG